MTVRIISLVLWWLLASLGIILVGAVMLSSGAIALSLNAAAWPFGKILEWSLRMYFSLLPSVVGKRVPL